MSNSDLRASTSDSNCFSTAVTRAEVEVLHEMQVQHRLSLIVAKPGGLKVFAEAFHFIRVNFVRLNFILGVRCPTHEIYWAGLAHNLMEEVGGEHGPAHNELYRWFLRAAGWSSEDELTCPAFAATFDHEWEEYCRNAPLLEALSAIAVYEVFDNPDYGLLLDVMTGAGLSEDALVFFKVHSKAEHFALFESFFAYAMKSAGGVDTFVRATNFVLEAQRKMWRDLLDLCETRLEAA